MQQISLRKYSKYFFIVCLFGLIYVSFILLRPFLPAILSGVVLAYIFYPLYRRLNKKLKNKNISSLLLSFFIILLILGPLIFIMGTLLKESSQFYERITTSDLSILEFFPKLTGNGNIDKFVVQGIEKAILFIINTASSFVLSIPSRILDFFITIFILFYLFKDGETLINKIKKWLPLKSSQKNILFKEIREVTSATVYGLIVTGLVQGSVGALGFFIFGIPNPLLWGIVMIILAILPLIGPILVWLPIGIIQIISGNLFSGIGILAYGFSIVSTIDNIIRPKLISKRARIHPVLILLGIVGGIKLFGLIGIIIGPLVLAILVVFLRLYKRGKK